ncbi:MAG: hypothetical protein ACI81V_000234 [Lentimonas sp.]|jgi:hypothetical protein
MSAPEHESLAGVTRIFVNLGAEPKSAEVMARQLLKRAQQIAEERDVPFVEAAQGLLKQVIEARQGDEMSPDRD